MSASLVGSEMCIRDSDWTVRIESSWTRVRVASMGETFSMLDVRCLTLRRCSHVHSTRAGRKQSV
eukprot:6534339-Alexandrium_andersonii.AAC.1